ISREFGSHLRGVHSFPTGAFRTPWLLLPWLGGFAPRAPSCPAGRAASPLLRPQSRLQPRKCCRPTALQLGLPSHPTFPQRARVQKRISRLHPPCVWSYSLWDMAFLILPHVSRLILGRQHFHSKICALCGLRAIYCRSRLGHTRHDKPARG